MALVQLLIVIICVYKVHGQASIQCGECRCVHIEPHFILNCENLEMHHMPVIEELIQRYISRAHMSGNMITSLRSGYFKNWLSLKYIDLTGNPDLACVETSKIPAHVKVEVECLREITGKYNK